MSGASKILIGSGGVDLPSDDEFDNVSFLSHFDGSNNGVNNVFDDGSDSDHTMTAAGDVTQGTFGPFSRVDGEWSNWFDGTDDYLSFADSSDWDLGSGSYTVEAWVWAGAGVSAATYNMIVGQWPSTGAASTNSWIMENSGGVVVGYAVISGTATLVAQSATLPLAQWVHVALVRNGNDHNIYINGVAGATTTNTNAYDTGTGAVEVGDFSNLANGDWDGYISNVRVVKGTAVYTSNFTPPTSALTAISGTVLLTCQSNRFKDNSASAHAVTIAGTPKVTAFTPFLTSKVYAAGTNGASAYMDGTGDYVSAADSADWILGDTFTVEAWIYPTTLNAYNIVVAQENNIIYTAGATRMAFYSASTDTHSDEVLELNQWSHVAFSVSSGTGYHYINGLRSGTVGTSIDVGDDSAVLLVGHQRTSWPQWPFTGYMSDVRIVNGTAVYSGTTYTVPTAPLAAITNTKLLLNMADGQALDSAAQNNVTLYGTADTSTTQKKFGTSSLFLEGDSDTDFAQLHGVIDFAGPFTIECWARAADTDIAYIWNIGQYRVEFGINGDTLRGYIYGTGYIDFFTSGEFTVDTWHHVAFVRDTSNVIKCYLNGTASGTTVTDSATFVSTGGIFIIGGEHGGATSINHGWDGYIDDFRISRFARYTSNFTAPTEAFPDKGK